MVGLSFENGSRVPTRLPNTKQHAAPSAVKDGDNKDKTVLVCQPKWLSTESYSLCLLLLSTLFFSGMSCFIQLASRTGIPSTELVFLRAIFQGTLIVLAMVFYFRDDDDDDDHNNDGVTPPPRLIRRPFGSNSVRNLVIARGVVGGIGFLLYYYTMSVLPIGDATTLLSLAPVITVLGAWMFLHEAIHLTHIFAAGACLVGSILLAQPSLFFGEETSSTAAASHSSYPTTGYVTGILGACCGSAVLILIRSAGKEGVHVLQLMFSWCCFGLLFSTVMGIILPVAFGIGQRFVLPTSFEDWMYVLGVCVFGSTAHFLMNYSVRYAPAGLASIMRSASIMWSYFLEVLVFHQLPRIITILGVGLILLALLAIALDKHMQQQQAKKKKQKKLEDRQHETDQIMELQQQKNKYGSIENEVEKSPLITLTI